MIINFSKFLNQAEEIHELQQHKVFKDKVTIQKRSEIIHSNDNCLVSENSKSEQSVWELLENKKNE